MRIPADGIIAEDKLTHYLLVQRLWDDKSGYLRQAGFVLEKWTELRDAIRALTMAVEAVEDDANEYGTFYRVDGVVTGPVAALSVTLIWMQRSVDSRF
jgi:hypothetical protein